jgi:hypothetical protein
MNFSFFLFDRNEDDSSDDMIGNNSLLTTSSGPIDDRHTRHITHDKRLLPSIILRRRLDHLSNYQNKIIFVFNCLYFS